MRAMSFKLGNSYIKRLTTLLALTLSAPLFYCAAAASFGPEPMRDGRRDERDSLGGRWTIQGLDASGAVRLLLEEGKARGDGPMVTLRLPLEKFEGLTTAQVSSSSSRVKFRLMREAGVFDCEGSAGDGQGTGTWTFTPHRAYLAGLAQMGFGGLSRANLWALAASDLKLDYVRELTGAGYAGLTIEQLTVMSSNNVRGSYIRDLKALGYEGLSVEELVALRSNGIEAELVQAYRSLLSGEIPAEQFIALRSNGVTTAYLQSLSTAGYVRPTASEALGLRVHGVTREFIERARARGQGNLSVDELIKMSVNSPER